MMTPEEIFEDRRRLLASVPGSFAHARRSGRGQLSIFDAMPDAGPSEVPVDPAIAAKYTDPALMDAERKVLGYYATRHPLEGFGPILDAFSSHPVARAAQGDNLKAIILGGFASGIEVKKTRKKEAMAHFSIDDGRDSIPALMWPKSYAAHAPTLADYFAGFFLGSVVNGGDEGGVPTMAVDRVVPLARAVVDLALGLVVRFGPGGASNEGAAFLRKVAAACPGRFDLYGGTGVDHLGRHSHCKVPGARISGGPRVVRYLSAAFGADNVRFLGRGGTVSALDVYPDLVAGLPAAPLKGTGT